MTVVKNLGICMDHSHAHLMEFTTDPIETRTIDSAFTKESKQDSLERGERIMHNKEQQMQADFYKKLLLEIRNFNKVLLFGATDAKVELYNIMKADHRFANTKVEVKQTDKMTENQEHAFVKEYFTTH